MRDWRAAVRLWETNGYRQPGKAEPANPALNYEQQSSAETDYSHCIIDLDHFYDDMDGA